MASDLCKWLLEHGEGRAAFEQFRNLYEHYRFGRLLLDAGIASSFLRGFGTMNLLNGKVRQAAHFYREPLDAAQGNPESVSGCRYWLAETSLRTNGAIEEDSWAALGRVATPIVATKSENHVSAETAVSGRLLSCLRPELRDNDKLFPERVG